MRFVCSFGFFKECKDVGHSTLLVDLAQQLKELAMVQAEENPRLPKLWGFFGQFLSLNAKVNL